MYAKHNSVLLLSVIISFIKCDEVVISVDTNNGRVNGRQQILFGNRAVNSFLGIPYAKPPIGNLRFKKPKPADNWSEPIDANEWPNACYQIPLTNTFQNTNFSENCLYLNIWSPVCDNNCTNHSNLKAVMFFIHGGGLIVGSSNEYPFTGQVLSAKGCVVVVTINYRLSIFGFLYSGTHSAPGNMGLWDMVLALQWVRDNIQYFGGDTNKITAFGQSGGSWAVSILILSPVSRNLFSQAGLMSGALISSEVANQTLAKNIWLKASTLIGCANNTDYAFNWVIIDCLRTKNASDFVGVVLSPDLVGDIFGELPLVSIDGIFLPKSPVEMLKCGDCKQNFNLMIGTVEDEGQATVALFDTNCKLTSPSNLNYSLVFVVKILKLR